MFLDELNCYDYIIKYSKVNSMDISRKTANHMKKFVIEWYEKLVSMEMGLKTSLGIKAG